MRSLLITKYMYYNYIAIIYFSIRYWLVSIIFLFIFCPMISIGCSSEGQTVKVEIHEEKFVVKGKTNQIVLFSDIKSVNFKNTDQFLLKIKFDEFSIVLEFDNLHLRDLIKGIILDKIQTVENIQARTISSNLDYSKSYRNVKNVISDAQFIKAVEKHTSLYFQRSIQNITSENFFKSLNQPLVDIFITMNCTITQFFNLLVSSYFYDIKNQKNAFDRLLLLRLRDFGSGMDYASRINSHSLLNMVEDSNSEAEYKVATSKPMDFEPLYPFKPENTEYSNNFQFELKSLTADFDIEIQKEDPVFVFDPSDFETAKDLCRLMFSSPDENLMKFSEDFTNLLIGKYGKDSLKYAHRLIPSFYKKDKLL